MNVEELRQILNTFDDDATVLVRVNSSIHPILDVGVEYLPRLIPEVATIVADHTEVLA